MSDIRTTTINLNKGDIFFCNQKAEKFLTKEIISQASKIFVEKGFALRNKYQNNKIIEISNFLEKLTEKLQKKYKLPKKLIAITGTNGKTSTCWFTFQILNLLGIKTGYIGGIGAFEWNADNNIASKICDLSNGLTTAPIDETYGILNKMYRNKNKIAIFEATSIALAKQKRLNGLNVDIAAFTNFTQDHLDVHKTMEEYFNAKLNLFHENLKKKGIAILNKNDSKFLELKEKISQKIQTFGSQGDIEILNTAQTLSGLKIKFTTKTEIFEIILNAFGDFQAENLICAIQICQNFSIKIEKIVNILDKIVPPIGRMEQIFKKNGKISNIFIDFSHTPDALENALKSLRKLGKVTCIFGCGGDRDKAKRPLMGNIAVQYANKVIITSDNPRSEDSNMIIEDIKKGVSKEELYKVECEINRSKAIEYGIKHTSSNDIILIAGKGHENYQIIGNTKIHFSDKEEALKWI